MKQAVQ